MMKRKVIAPSIIRFYRWQKLRKACLFFLFLLTPSLCFPWGAKGHKIVAELAKSTLQKSIADSVQSYLGDISFQDAAVWMDVIRSDHSYDSLKPWHYLNVDKGSTYEKTGHPDVAVSIEKAIFELRHRKGKNKEQTRFYLLVLFHLVGDIHQPLHCGYGSDKGGNAVELTFMGKQSNLHRVWDSDLLDFANISLEDCKHLSDAMGNDKKSQVMTSDIISWVGEARSYLPGVYNFKDGQITQEYVDQNKAVMTERLAVAGMRLAKILNEIFRS